MFTHINHSEFPDILKRCIETGHNILIAGPYGIGKTKSVKSILDDMNANYKYLSCSNIESYEIKGILYPDKSKSVCKLIPLESVISDTLVIDEIYAADISIQKSLLEVASEGTSAGVKVTDQIIAIGTPPSYGYKGMTELIEPLYDRFPIKLEIIPDSSYLYNKFSYLNLSKEDYETLLEDFSNRMLYAILDIYTRDINLSKRLHGEMIKTVSSDIYDKLYSRTGEKV